MADAWRLTVPRGSVLWVPGSNLHLLHADTQGAHTGVTGDKGWAKLKASPFVSWAQPLPQCLLPLEYSQRCTGPYSPIEPR